MKRLFLFLPLIVAVAVGVFLFAGIGKDPTKLESVLIGKPVPEFSLESLNDPERRLDTSLLKGCLLYTSPSPRDRTRSRMPSSA